MLGHFISYIALIVVILFLVMIARKLRIAYPILLVIAGLLISVMPGMPLLTINPQYIFVIFLPPLLYEAAWDTSWKDLWRWRRVIGSFAFLIVIFTSLVVALVSSAVIPGFTMALGFLLGGITSPPDAVSAISVLKYVKVPKRMEVIIKGESLLNDASSLIVFRFALIAVDTGHFIFREAALSFIIVIAMGILIGVLIGMAYYVIHRWLPTTPDMDVVLSLTAPYVMYIAVQRLKERFETDQLYEDEDKNQEQEDYRTIYMNLLEHQRAVLHEMNKKMETDESLIRKYLGMLDLEEEKLRIRFETAED